MSTRRSVMVGFPFKGGNKSVVHSSGIAKVNHTEDQGR